MRSAGEATMDGKVVVVTGASSGIGRSTAQALAGMGARVIACGRDRAKLDEAVAAIRTVTGNDAVEPLLADLSSMEEVRGLAAAIRESTDRLDVLVNNAGVGVGREVTTADGVELNFAVNHLAPFLLTRELLPLLEASAPARIVTVSSGMYAMVKELDVGDLVNPERFDWKDAYARSKLCNILFTRELARRQEGTGVTANCLHPGVIDTGFGGDGDLGGITEIGFAVMKWFLPGPDKGARTSVYLASSTEVDGVSGEYFVKCRREEVSALARDEGLARRVWELSEERVGG